ncbi:hypothetical protein B0S90_0626 [Caldicellulosiruptor bescii]|uniref:Uncharacterized protein n=2 Tax=Caldicellulosiruptor bescii TaxID=31899 RepID=B9MN36_CALBD|nr:hypothetical protein Athe_0356 [Caldicellulosiruptor bescii DSM 6725]PBC89524.1 hypothetical protein B0S87_2629 [Caldicellulosiruptor bescii]PBC89846.1 hypothetical protein B0S89_0130 [Caldicellulosiruptor bescii]PBD04727.1 hypothetical protein B0S85_2418 [Caldicellulosiruptor bescii]PBD05642.1 hypothetical protein B0S90_0626 [Caldicellulosiruptor bescii]
MMYGNSDILELRAEDSRSNRWIIAKEFRVFQGHSSWYNKRCNKT